ncbi:MAG: hypothetical protein ABIC82_06435 [bacterium]
MNKPPTFCKPTDLKKSNSKKICCGSCKHSLPIPLKHEGMAKSMEYDLLCDLQKWFVNSNNICKTELGKSNFEAKTQNREINNKPVIQQVQSDLF